MKEPRYQPQNAQSRRLRVVEYEREPEAGARSIRGEFLRLRDLIDRIEELSVEQDNGYPQHTSDSFQTDYSVAHQNGWHDQSTEDEVASDADFQSVPVHDADDSSELFETDEQPHWDEGHVVQEFAIWQETDDVSSVVEFEEDETLDLDLSADDMEVHTPHDVVTEEDYSVAVDLSSDITPFDPYDPDLEQPHAVPATEGTELSGEPAASDASEPVDDLEAKQNQAPGPGEDVERWWVTFNGQLSLDCLAMVRARLHQSPFVIEARFEEIDDGVIVLRLVTGSELTEPQLGWVVRQLIESCGLQPDCAILSHQ